MHAVRNGTSGHTSKYLWTNRLRQAWLSRAKLRTMSHIVRNFSRSLLWPRSIQIQTPMGSMHVWAFSPALWTDQIFAYARWVPCAPAPQLAVAGPEVLPYPAVVHAASESAARGKALRDLLSLFCSHCCCAWLAHQKGARTTSTGPNTPHSSTTPGAPVLDPHHSSGRRVGVARPGALQVAGLSCARRPYYHCVEVLQRRQAAVATKVGKTQTLRCKKRWIQGRYPRSSSHN